MILLVEEESDVVALLLRQSRRQTLSALCAPEADVVAISDFLMSSVIEQDACRDIESSLGPSHKTDSQVALSQLKNDSIITNSRPFASKFSYVWDMCYGTALHSPPVKPLFGSRSVALLSLCQGLIEDLRERPGSGTLPSMSLALHCSPQAFLSDPIGGRTSLELAMGSSLSGLYPTSGGTSRWMT